LKREASGVEAMKISLTSIAIQLAEQKIIGFRDAKDVFLECTDGLIWLTIEGKSCDFLLTKGEQQRIESNGLVLIQGLPSASALLVTDSFGDSTQPQGFCCRIHRMPLQK
jgi:hypothetical protein